jgi:hypothetical protein
MTDESFKQLYRLLIEAAIIGTYQKKELVFRDSRRPDFKIYMYSEPNHNRPHVHVYFGEEEASVCIRTRDVLAGSMSEKLLRPSRQWVSEHEASLLTAWDEIQAGKKPELLWARNA